MLKILSVLIFLIALSFSIDVIAPFQGNFKDGDVIDLGSIGPGQTVSIELDPIVKIGGIHGIGGVYDQAIAEDLPRGWTSKKSKLYGNPLQVTITADPNALEGDYLTEITVIDEFNGEKLGNISFFGKVKITYDVMDLDVSPNIQTVGPNQPAKFDVVIENKGSTSDVFEINAPGPSRWQFKKQVFIPAKSTKKETIEIVGSEEEIYRTTISVTSLASENIHAEENVTLEIRPGLIGDYKATNNGLLVFPVFEGPIYALAGLLSNIFR